MTKISFCASALRPNHWEECYNSLAGNRLDDWELIFVGPNPPLKPLPSNFIYIQSNVKPAQCYEIAFRHAKGELLTWTADDATYPGNVVNDVWKCWSEANNRKMVLAFRTIEDDRDITEWHRLRGKDPDAPRMAPFGVMNTKYFHELGGYDRRFICGQSENDVVMRVYEDGGSLKIIPIPVFVNHKDSHNSSTMFRSGWFHEDRKVLEGAWIKNGEIQQKRLFPLERFEDEDIITKTQSQKGNWE
jgi:hypothetical protein